MNVFFEHESDESDESFYLRLKNEYSGHSGDYLPLICGASTNLVFNLIYTQMFFLNTNRTNLTNLVGRDMVYIRGIREITSLWSVGLRQISCST